MADTPKGNPTVYRVLARKYRPKTFTDLIGQDALVRTLTNAFATGRIAQAYMLTGVRGVGKTTTARLIARALNYPTGATVDMPEITPQCEAILESRHMDVIEMDAASNTGVDNMREIIDSVRYAPVSVRTKVYIIDEVHMLSKSAFNALLKTLEEPPPHVKFIFATTEIRKVPVTILSRCQRFDLKRLDASLLMQHYGRIAQLENVVADEDALRMIARAAEGSVRDGLSLLDQAIAYGDGKVQATHVEAMLGIADRALVIDLFESVAAGKTAEALALINKQHDAGCDPETVLADLADFTHFVTRLKVVRASAMADGARTESEKTRGAGFADSIAMSHLTRMWQMLLKGYAETQTAPQPILAAEMLVVRICYASNLPSGEDLAKLAAKSTPAPAQTSVSSVVETLRRDATRHDVAGNVALAAQPSAAASSTGSVEGIKQSDTINSFADVVALADLKRDIKLKSDLERCVRPISVKLGQIEVALEPGTHPGLPGELSRKLEAWTGRRWVVMVASAGGETPVSQQKKIARDQSFKSATENPDVIGILKAFPGSVITDVRSPVLATEPQQNMEETDEEPV